MPGMVICNRRWSVATDDFLWIGLFDIVFYFPWVCWTAVTIQNYLGPNITCSGSTWCCLQNVFLVGSCCLFTLSTLIAIAFVYFSTRGTISCPEPRQNIIRVVQFKAILAIFIFLSAILGSVILAQDFVCYQDTLEFSARSPTEALVIFLWIVVFGQLFLVWLCYDPRGRLHKKTKLRKTIPSEYLSPPVPSGSSRKWRLRFQAFCLWFTAPSEDRRAAISTVSELLAFISHDLDLVASDLIAGLRLYRQKCLKSCREEEMKFQYLPKISLPDKTPILKFPPPDMPEWMNLKLAAHYFKIGMGVFGWPWTMYRNIACGLCELCKRCIFCFPFKSQSKNVEGDNCCGCNLAGLETTSGVEYQDLVHVCFINRVYQVPFFVSLDHSTSTVVLTARGSMSCADALTDVSASFEPIDESGCPKESLCHGGLLMAARRIKAKLEEKKILEQAFAGREHYGLVVTGHSLGAGVASLLTLMYRNVYSNIRCFAFAPPPVFNEVVLPETFNNVFTVIYGNDVVSYLNYWNVRNMVVEVVDLLKECQLPKHKVLLGVTGGKKEEKERNAGSTTTVDIGEINCAVTDVSDGKQVDPAANGDANGDAKGDIKADINGCPAKPESKTRFYVGGRILNIKHSKKFGYRLRLCDAKEFQPLLCKRQMVAHHFPNYLEVTFANLGHSEVLHSEQLNNEADTATTATAVDIEPEIKTESSPQPLTKPPPPTQPPPQPPKQSAPQPPKQSAPQPPTQSAPQPPTQSPPQTPKQPPTPPPAQSLTPPPTQSLTPPPTQPPKQSAPQPPTQSPTQSPPQPPTHPPTQSLTPPPTRQPPQPPTQSPPQPPTQSQTPPPTQPLTPSPTQSPTPPPIQPPPPTES